MLSPLATTSHVCVCARAVLERHSVHASGRDPALRAKASVLLVAYSRLVVACRRPCTTRFACSLLLNENADIELRKLCGQRAVKRANAWRRHCSSMAAGKITAVKAALSRHSLEQCRRIADAALATCSPEEARTAALELADPSVEVLVS